MKTRAFTFKANVWLWPGQGVAWHFVSVPKKESEQIAAQQEVALRRTQGKRRGWGAVRIEVAVGRTSWETSIFPDKKSGCYLLPLKSAVRKKEGIFAGDTISIALAVLR